MPKKSILDMKFSDVYPLLVNKAERKGRTKDEVDQVIFWLLGYTRDQLEVRLREGVTCAVFYGDAPALNPACGRITGTVCGVRVEEVADPLTRRIRYLDKLVDELARGWPMEKILRK